MSPQYPTQYLIDGELYESTSNRTFQTENPTRAEVLATVPAANAEDVDRAVESSKSAFESSWKHTDPKEREAVLEQIADVFREYKDELTDIEVTNNGSTYRPLAQDIDVAISTLDYYSGLMLEVKGETIETPGETIDYTLREPIGVVAGILPFNHPLAFAASKIGPALATGNTVVLKPSEYTPLSVLVLATYLVEEEAVPDGVVNIIAGDGQTGSYLASHSGVGMVSFTGSIETGKKVMKSAADNVAPVLLELGGKNPSIVFPDANLEEAVPGCIGGMNMGWQGQSCASISRLLVHESIHKEMVERLKKHFDDVTVGRPTDDSSDMGAVVSRTQYEKVLEYFELGRESEATLLTGGEPATVPGVDGYYVEPTLFDNVDPESRLAQEEVFGPILLVIPWTDYKEMISIANGVKYGLTASIWTNNLKTAMETANRTQAGYVWINQHGRFFQGAPYGGVKESGLGRVNCLEELYEHTQTKNVNVDLETTQSDWF